MFGIFKKKGGINGVQPPADVVDAFAEYAGKDNGDNTEMTVDQLCRFLIEYQKEEQDECRAQSESEQIVQVLQQRRDKDQDSSKNNGLSIDQFFQYLFDADLNGPIRTEVHHEMTAPLQHYFIYTGHNSYLTGNQLSSDCSDVPIIKALQRGVRVIELDIWPNSSKDDINVVHGGTLTAPVTLLKCLTSIQKHAFEASPYPVILDLEDHLTPDLQAKVAEMVTEIFGDMLYYIDSSNIEEFPSPDKLKHRILLAASPPEDDSVKVEEDEQLLEDDTASVYEGGETQDSSSGVASELEYRQLITIQSYKPEKGLRHALLSGSGKFQCLNLSEGALERAVSIYSSHVLRFTPNNFIRMYPKGTRIGSSNYHPMVAWAHGAQLVAFNMQGYDKALWLMHGMFKANGGCGYIKKPSFLLNTEPQPENNVYDPKAHMGVKTTLKVRVYMGDGWHLDFSKTHFDMFSPPDFFVKLRLEGVKADYSRKQTKVIDDDWNPIWNEEFSFEITVPELAILRLEVGEYDTLKTDFAGQTCLPVCEIRSGIRAVPLFDQKGEKFSNVKLLVRFQFVPNSSS